VHDVAGLIAYCRNNLFIAAAGIVHRNASVKVQVRLGIFIIKIHPFCFCRHEREPLVSFDHVPLRQIYHFLRC
jgi:hypothetical protein